MLKEAAKYQFQAKCFGFSGLNQQQLYVSQWQNSKLLYVLFRAVFFVYLNVWLIVQLIDEQSSFFIYLSNWMEVVACCYVTFAFSVALHGFLQERRGRSQDGESFKWYHKLTLVLFNMAFTFSIIICFVFWLFLAPNLTPDFVFHPISIHLHLCVALLFIVDLFVSSFEIRLLHFFYSEIFGAAYIVFTLILHATKVNSKVYYVLDWANNVKLALITTFLIGLVAVPLLQLGLFLLYALRKWIKRRVVKGNSKLPVATAQEEHVNQ